MKTTKIFLKMLFTIIVMTQTTQAQQTAKNLFYLPMPSRPLCPICDGGNAKSKAICHHNLNKVEDIGVGTSWDIGRKSRNCGAFGLCRCSSITFEYSQRVKSNKNSFNSTISLTTEKRVLFSVDKENMLIISNYFKGEQLILDEDFVIDDKEVLSKLHLESYTLKKGLYKFKFNIKSSKFEVII